MTIRHVPRFARPETPQDAETASRDSDTTRLAEGPMRRAAAKRFREVELTRWLCERHGLDGDHARAVAARLLSSTPRIRGAFQKWWLTGRVEELEVEGYSLRRLVREKGMSPIGALLTLSLLAARGDDVREELDRRPEGEVDVETALRMAEG